MRFPIIRYPNEKTSLVFSVLLAFFISYLLFEISPWLLLLLLAIQLIYILIIQKHIQGNSIKISKVQMPHIHNIIMEVAQALDMDPPDSYVTFSPEMNAYVMGFKNPYTLVLNSALVEAMDEEELHFIISHELGHIKLSHAKFTSLVSPLNRNIPVITFIFNQWIRKTEYSADRVGLLTGTTLKKCISALLKITVGKYLYKQMNMEDIVSQIENANDEALEKFSELFLTHPYVFNRIKHLVEFNYRMNSN